MDEAEKRRPLWRRLVPKIFKAALFGALKFFVMFFLPMMLLGPLLAVFPVGYSSLIYVFAAVEVSFTVAGQLLSGTIFQHGLNVAKTLARVFIFVYALNGGLLDLTMPMGMGPAQAVVIRLAVDLRVYLAMLISVDMVGVAQGILQAVNFLAEGAEKPVSVGHKGST